MPGAAPPPPGESVFHTAALSAFRTLGAVTPNNPLDADGSVAQAFVSYQCLVQGTGTNPPLVVS